MCLLSKFLSKVTVTSCSTDIKSSLLLDDALKPATPLTSDQWRDQWCRRLECVVQRRYQLLLLRHLTFHKVV